LTTTFAPAALALATHLFSVAGGTSICISSTSPFVINPSSCDAVTVAFAPDPTQI